MRQFIRHPVDLPVEIGAENAQWTAEAHTHDISAGGLAVRVPQALSPGACVRVCIPYVQPTFEARARVAWCRQHVAEGFELGVTFLDAEDAYMARMVEQMCHIEDYRMSVTRSQGRQISVEEAAREWIERFAAEFPMISAGQQPH